MGQPVKLSDRALSLQMAGGDRLLSQLLSEVDTAKGRKRVEATLNSRPYPHYEPVPEHPELVRRIEEDGSETVGHFVGREFEAIKVDR